LLNLRRDIVYLFLDAQALVFDAARAAFQDFNGGKTGPLGGSGYYASKHRESGLCLCCPRMARPNRTKCEQCAELAKQASKRRYAQQTGRLVCQA
jgi:hypothetical protein